MEQVIAGGDSYSFPADILKAGEEKNGRIPITIIPSSPTKDRVNDKILLKAFDDSCIKSYLNDGIIDYDHLSFLGETPEIRARAIIGEPENFFIDKKRNVPVCEGFLFKGNPFVDDSIMPALEAKSKVFGASLGGKVLLKSSGIDPNTQSKLNTISKISLKHIAITPLQKAVHQGTSVRLRKSADSSPDEMDLIFSTFEDFVKSFEDGEYLQKALEAGAATDMVAMTGGQILQNQSLEGDALHRIKTVLPFIIEAIISGLVSGRYEDFVRYLTARGLSPEEADRCATLIATNSASIVKLIF